MKKILRKIKNLFKKRKKSTVLKRIPLDFNNSETPVVSIIIPFYNQEAYTLCCLTSLKKHLSDRYSFEIILIDDNSPEAHDLSLIKGIQIIKNETNLGFLKNINLGIKKSKGEYIYILNNDTIVKNGFLDELFYVFENYENVGAVGSKLLNADNSLQEAGATFLKDFDIHQIFVGRKPEDPDVNYIYKTDYCSGCSLLFKKFDDNGNINLLDEHFAPAYFEETDFCFSLRHTQNKEIYCTGFSEIIHYNGVSYNQKETNNDNSVKDLLFKTNKSKFYTKWKSVVDAIKANNTYERLSELHNNKSIIFFHTEIPRYDVDSGSNRLKEIIECFLESGYKVSIVVPGQQKDNEYVAFYQRLGVLVYYENKSKDLREFLDINFLKDSIIWYYGPGAYQNFFDLTKELFNKGNFVYDMVDIHHLRIKRTLEINPNDKWCQDNYEVYKEIELNLTNKVDLIIAVSEDEKNYMKKYYDDDLLTTISNIHYLKVNPEEIPSFDEREHIIFIGSTHHPNVDAVKWLANEIMPKVWIQNPNIIVNVIGSVKNSFKKLNSFDDRINFLGFVPSVDYHFKNSRMMIAPLTIGAGVKGKIGQALEFCLPIVTTNIGAEGMNLKHNESALIANDTENFANEILRLYNDKNLWNTLSGNSKNNLELYSKEHVKNLITEIFK